MVNTAPYGVYRRAKWTRWIIQKSSQITKAFPPVKCYPVQLQFLTFLSTVLTGKKNDAENKVRNYVNKWHFSPMSIFKVNIYPSLKESPKDTKNRSRLMWLIFPVELYSKRGQILILHVILKPTTVPFKIWGRSWVTTVIHECMFSRRREEAGMPLHAIILIW